MHRLRAGGGEFDRGLSTPICLMACRTYVSQDVIRRVLEEHCGRAVFFVMGVTDVDDKIIARARATYVGQGFS